MDPDARAAATPSPAAPSESPVSAAWQRHRVRLAAYVGRLLPASLRSAVDVEDVLHDVWLESMRTAGAFVADAESDGLRWLKTIARRRVGYLARRRQASRQSTEAAFAAAVDDPVVLLLEELAMFRHTPSRSAANHETWAAVAAAMGRLSPDYAAVLRARYLDGLPAREVAACTGRTPTAIDKLCSRAVAALRAELAGGTGA